MKGQVNMEYMSAPEAAKKWGISERRVQKLCEETAYWVLKTRLYVADTERRRKARRRTQKRKRESR